MVTCSPRKESSIEQPGKMDPSLRLLISRYEHDRSDEVIEVLIELHRDPDGEAQILFREYNLELDGMEGKILAARGRVSDIRRITASSLVKHIALSQKRQPL